MAIYNGTQKVDLSGIDKVYVGSQLVYQKITKQVVSIDVTTWNGSTSLLGAKFWAQNQYSAFEFPGVITATYDDNTTEDVTSECVFTNLQSEVLNTNTTGNWTVFISYTYNGSSVYINDYATFYVNKEVDYIVLSGQTTSLPSGSTFSFGGTVTAHYTDGSTANVTSATTFSGYNMSAAGTYTVTATYNVKTTVFTTSVITSTAVATYSLTITASWHTLWSGTVDIYHNCTSGGTWSKSGAGEICSCSSGSNRFRITWSTTYGTNVTYTKNTADGIYWGGNSQTKATTFGTSPKDITTPSATANILWVKGFWSGMNSMVTQPQFNIYRNSSQKIGVTLNTPSGTRSGYNFKMGIKITKIEQYY